MSHVYLLLCAIFWGWTFVATKVLLAYITPLELVGLRLFVALPTLFLLVRWRGASMRFTRPEWGSMLLASLVLIVHFLVQVSGLNHTSATHSAWLICTVPLVLALLSFIALRERLNPFELSGIGIACAGVLLLVSGGNPEKLTFEGSRGDYLVLTSALTWSVYTLLTRGVLKHRSPLAVSLAILLPAGASIILLVGLTSPLEKFLSLPLEGVLAALFLGVVSQAVAHWFWQEGVAKVGAARAGLYLYLEPLSTMALAVPYLGEPLTLPTLAGGLLVLLALLLAQWPTLRPFVSPHPGSGSGLLSQAPEISRDRVEKQS